MSTTAAQDEFNDLVAKNTHRETLHPEDRGADANDEEHTEEDSFRNSQIDAAMRMPTSGPAELNLPPLSFDHGRSTGVKGVIADARSYEAARRSKWRSAMQSARNSFFGGSSRDDGTLVGVTTTTITGGRRSESESESEGRSPGSDEQAFLQQWREARRKELESEASRAGRPRRLSPSMRIWGKLDEVDATGYLDAIEKVSRDATVVVYVYDHEVCSASARVKSRPPLTQMSQGDVSSIIESALRPIVKAYSTIHFVKIHYEDIEFDNAAVPAILGYRQQGELFANLTGVVEMIPDDEEFTSETLRKLLSRHDIL